MIYRPLPEIAILWADLMYIVVMDILSAEKSLLTVTVTQRYYTSNNGNDRGE